MNPCPRALLMWLASTGRPWNVVRRCHSGPNDNWKRKSNYFYNYWNQQQFGPVRKADPGLKEDTAPRTKSDQSHWLGQMTQAHDGVAPLPDPGDPFDATLGVLATESAVLKGATESVVPMGATTSDVAIPSWRNPSRSLLTRLNLGENPAEALLARSHQRKSSARSPCASVSKILKETMPVSRQLALKQWEERMIAQMGQIAFSEFQQEMLSRGHRLHSFIEHYLINGDKTMASSDPISQNHCQSIDVILERFSRPYCLESQVVHPTLNYHGYLDCVAVYQKNTLALIDWKTSEKKKTNLASTFDNPLQIAAYVGAFNHDPRYDVEIRHGLIVIVHNDGLKANVLSIPEAKLNLYWQQWVLRLAKFDAMAQYPTSVADVAQ